MESLPIAIQISKSKTVLLVIACILFVLGGIWMLGADGDEGEKYSILFLKGIGILSIGFFGMAGVIGLKQLFDSKSGLVIDEEGIVDHTNASSVGLIEWKDIIGIRMGKVESTKFLLIDVIDDAKYIEKAPNKMAAKLMQANKSMYGTPLSITTNTLAIKFEELEKLIQEQLTSRFE